MRELDADEQRATLEAKRTQGCKCGYPDMPGYCPGPAACPMCQEDDETYDCVIHGTGPGPDCPRC